MTRHLRTPLILHGRPARDKVLQDVRRVLRRLHADRPKNRARGGPDQNIERKNRKITEARLYLMDVLPEKRHEKHEADKLRDRLRKDVSCPLINKSGDDSSKRRQIDTLLLTFQVFYDVFTIFQSFRICGIRASSKL